MCGREGVAATAAAPQELTTLRHVEGCSAILLRPPAPGGGQPLPTSKRDATYPSLAHRRKGYAPKCLERLSGKSKWALKWRLEKPLEDTKESPPVFFATKHAPLRILQVFSRQSLVLQRHFALPWLSSFSFRHLATQL